MLEIHDRKTKRLTVSGFLRMMDDVGRDLIPMTRFDAWKRSRGYLYLKDLEEYFPSDVERVVGRLARSGSVEKVQTKEGVKIIITDKGKKEIFKFDIEKFTIDDSKWDGRWRIVFFDILESKRRKREVLRRFLEKIGLWQIQQSVWISPYDCIDKIKYLREVLDIPHEVKFGVLESIENELEIKDHFGLK